MISLKTISMKTVRNLAISAALIAVPAASFASVFISVGIAPPPLPVYAQPICPGEGYLWTPGYWGYGGGGYYWVPGVWVQPPSVGLLWTPAYWGFAGGVYGFHSGYWGPHVGFYGGVNYGFGYGGVGFFGGRWDGGRFAYNTAVNNVNINVIHNTYNDRTVIQQNTIINNNHVSYNGGPQGIQARPNAQQMNYDRENHVAPTANQQQHFQNAQANRANFASANGGHPQMAAQERIGTTAGAQASRGFVGNGGGEGARNTNRNGFGTGNQVNTRQGNQQSRINNGGTLNQQQRQQINQRQNNVSRSITNDNHNANTDAAAAARNGRTQQGEQRGAQRQERQEAPRGGGERGGGDHPRR